MNEPDIPEIEVTRILLKLTRFLINLNRILAASTGNF